MAANGNDSIEILRSELAAAHARIVDLEAELATLRTELVEVTKLSELQKADLDRYRAAIEASKPNQPERVARDQLQLAFERVLETFNVPPPANDAATDNNEDVAGTADDRLKSRGKGKGRDPHGRRALDLTNLPVEVVTIDPPEVVAVGGKGFRLVGQEISERVANKPASTVRLRIVRTKWAPMTPAADVAIATLECAMEEPPTVIVAPIPESVWPHTMADPSLMARIIIAKYGDCLPLHRQECMSERDGFIIPRSTQCGWLGPAHGVTYRVVDAMFTESRHHAFCIATDATGAPVRAPNKCEAWHIFVFIADRDHVVFRHSRDHTSVAIRSMLAGYRGHLLADAAPIYDAVYSSGDIIEVCCWFHCRRYFWRALESDRDRAFEALALIAKLFEIDRSCKDLPMPLKTKARADRSRPILELLDRWVDRHRAEIEPRGLLDKAIGYYRNQRDALRRFLSDGRIRLDNSISEQQLRNAVLGRHNWTFFANETGLRWYTTFRSLIASCALHGLNPQLYLEQLLRIAPHWPVTKMLELSPKYWAGTVARLDARHRAILERPWEATWPRVGNAIESRRERAVNRNQPPLPAPSCPAGATSLASEPSR